MSMFGSLGHKIAHASTIPSLGNQDLRALQDLIVREKEVITSIQRLSGELVRANEALKVWGQGEGLDLEDTLSQSAAALNHIVSALNGFAGHEQNIRAHMKEIRTREENLDDLQKRRKNVMVKAEAAEKKLNKMGSENKYLAQQTNLLAQLTDEMRQLGIEILSEEARVGDFKRRVTKQFMLLKFGGLLEFAEKATIVGELGKLIINEIPLDTTAPGHPRVPYHGSERTVQLTSEIARCINEIRFVADPDHSALAAIKGDPKVNASHLSGLVPPPPLSTIIEPEFGGQTQPPSPSSPKKATFGSALPSLGRSPSPERRRDPPLSLPVGNREPYQANSERIAFTDPPNLFLPEIGGPPLSASLGIASQSEQSIEGLPTLSTSNTTANSNSTMDRTFMNIPSDFGGRSPLVTENRTVSSSASLASLTPVSKPQYNTLPLSRPSEERPAAPSVTGAPSPLAPAPPVAIPAPLAPLQQGASQGSISRIIDPPGTKSAAGRFAAFPLKSRRITNAQPPESTPTTDGPSQSRPARPNVVVPTTTNAPNSNTAKTRDAPSTTEFHRPSIDEENPPPTSGSTKSRIRRNDSARVRFAATPVTPAFTKDSDDAADNGLDVPRVGDNATEEILAEHERRLDNRGGPVSVANDGLSVAPLKKKPSFEPPEPARDVDDMSEAELNAMIDAIAAQVGQGSSPSGAFSTASQFSPASGSPPSTLPTPSSSRIGSATYSNRTLASGNPTGGDPLLTGSGRTSAAAFKRPASRIPGLPPNPRFGGGDTTSGLRMTSGTPSRVLSSPEPRRSTEEVGQASQRAITPPTKSARANQTPSPPPAAPVQPPEHPSREVSPTPSSPAPSETTTNTLEKSHIPPAAYHSQTTLPPPPPPSTFPWPVPPAPQALEMDFEIIHTPEYEYERDELSLKPRLSPLDISMTSPLASSQALDSSRGYMSLVSSEGTNMPLPRSAGPPLPDSLIPGGRQDPLLPSQSLERGDSRPGSEAPSAIPLSLRPGTPRGASPVQQDFTGVGPLARTSKDGSRRLSNGPPSIGPPSLLPLDPHSPIFDFGEFGDTRGDMTIGLLQKAPSGAGYGEGKFTTNLEDEYQQEKQADPKRGNESWR